MFQNIFHKLSRSKWTIVVVAAILLPLFVLTISTIQNLASDKSKSVQAEPIDRLINEAQARLDNDQQNPTR